MNHQSFDSLKIQALSLKETTQISGGIPIIQAALATGVIIGLYANRIHSIKEEEGRIKTEGPYYPEIQMPVWMAV